jgi:hypothetical protein
MVGLVDSRDPRCEMRHEPEIEGRDARRRTAPPRETVVMDVVPTVEGSAAVIMLHDAKGVDPRGCR